MAFLPDEIDDSEEYYYKEDDKNEYHDFEEEELMEVDEDEEIVLDLIEDGPHDSNRFLDMDLDPSIIPVTDFQYKYIESFQELDIRPRVLLAFQEDVNVCRPTRLYSIALQMITSKPYKSLLIQGRRKSDLDNCYVLGLLERVKVKEEENPQALVLCPTTEMANQIHELVLELGRYTSISSYVLEDPEDGVMPPDAHIVIGVSNTVQRLIKALRIDMSHVRMVVLEAADQILERSLGANTEFVMRKVDAGSQVLLIYGTMTDKLMHYLPKILPKWQWDRLFLNQEEYSIFRSRFFKIKLFNDDEVKAIAIRETLNALSCEKQVIVYVDTATKMDILKGALASVEGVVYTSQLPSGNQEDPIIRFKSCWERVLVTSFPLSFNFDQSRFDQSKVNLVIFYDIPVNRGDEPDYKTYYSLATRVGLNYDTNEGAVLHLLSSTRDELLMKKTETYFGRDVESIPVRDGYDVGGVREILEALAMGGLVSEDSGRIWEEQWLQR